MRRFRALRACALVTRWVDRSVTLDHFLERAAPAESRIVTAAVAHLAATMHNAGYVDRDLHLRNLLVCGDDTAADRPERTVLKIDSPAGTMSRAVRLRVHDLACLEIGGRRFLSRTARLRFFKKYGAELRGRARIDNERKWLAAIRGNVVKLEPKEGPRVDAVRSGPPECGDSSPDLNEE